MAGRPARYVIVTSDGSRHIFSVRRCRRCRYSCAVLLSGPPRGQVARHDDAQVVPRDRSESTGWRSRDRGPPGSGPRTAAIPEAPGRCRRLTVRAWRRLSQAPASPRRRRRIRTAGRSGCNAHRGESPARRGAQHQVVKAAVTNEGPGPESSRICVLVTASAADRGEAPEVGRPWGRGARTARGEGAGGGQGRARTPRRRDPSGDLRDQASMRVYGRLVWFLLLILAQGRSL